jgi:hypothetical protein
MIPLIELKYKSDLYENIETFNKYCLNNDIQLIKELEVKDTYMWNISCYIYDVEHLSKFFYKDSYWGEDDYYKLNRHERYAIINGESIDNIMKIYNKYYNYSLPFFIILACFFIYQMSKLISIDDDDYLKVCIAGSNSYTIEENFRYYIYSLFIYILLFIIFFSLILKKLSELYTDTDTYYYIMLMKELDIIYKENDTENSKIIAILKKYYKNNINDISYSVINNNDISNELIYIYNKNHIYINNKKYKITLKNIENIKNYNSEESKNIVKNKIDEIFRFIYVYILFIIIPIYILSLSLQGNYIYLLFTLIILIIFSVFMYNIYNILYD